LEEAGAITLTLDISVSSQEITEFAKKVLELPLVKERGGVDILVNNAGYTTLAALEEVS
jgi:NAD(P)-dependent dehydrogenase (short-subunit alcohol dehydrogenase family)